MRSLPVLFVILFLISFVVSCSAGEDQEKEALNSAPVAENGNQMQSATEDSVNTRQVAQNDDSTYEVDGENPEDLPRIETLKIVSMSAEDIRQGFKIEVTTNNKDAVITDYYRIVWMHNGEELTGESGETLGWMDDFKKGDKIKVVLIPSLGDTESPLVTESEFSVPNSPPEIVSEPPEEIQNGKFEYKVEAEDPDGDDIQFLLKNSPKGMTIEPATGLISWDFTQEKPGTDYNIEIVATDTDGLSYTQQLTLTIPEKQPQS